MKFVSLDVISKYEDFFFNYWTNNSELFVHFFDVSANERKIAKGPLELELFMSGPGEWKDIHETSLKHLHKPSEVKTWQFLRSLRELQEPVFGYSKQETTHIHKLFDHASVNDKWDINQFRTAFIDIETESENDFGSPEQCREVVNAITVHDSFSKTLYAFGIKGTEVDVSKYKKGKVHYKAFKNEMSMMTAFLKFMEMAKFSILSGWYSDGFDVPYLYYRWQKLAGDNVALLNLERCWSPFGKNPKVNHKGYVKIPGVSCLDYLDVYKQQTWEARDNFKLDTIVEVELGEEKLKHESGIPGYKLYSDYYEDFILYNIHDVNLLVKLEEKLSFFYTVISHAYFTFSNLEDTQSQIRMIENLVYNEFRAQKIAMPYSQEKNTKTAYEGAFVFPIIPGRHNWLISLDVSSEYPSIIKTLNISPELLLSETQRALTVKHFVDNDIDTDIAENLDATLACSGYMYRKDKMGLFPALIKKLLDQRNESKRLKLKYEQMYIDTKDEKHKIETARYEARQATQKVTGVAVYGAMASPFFCYYDTSLAESITLTGQYFIRNVGNVVNKWLNNELDTNNENYVVFGDTDSVGLRLEPIVKKYNLDSSRSLQETARALSDWIDENIQPQIEIAIQQFYKSTNAYAHEMAMKREAICDTSLFVAKKKYVMNLLLNETTMYDLPGKIKLSGLDAKQSAIPKACRDWQMEAITKLIASRYDEVYEDTDRLRDIFKTAPLNDIGKNVSANNLDMYKSYYLSHGKKKGKTVPYNVRAALNYNWVLEKLKLDQKYEKVKSGEKVHILYLKSNNPYGLEYIGWADELPPELELEKWIDRELMFEKLYLAPLNRIANCEGKSIESSVDNMRLF